MKKFIGNTIVIISFLFLLWVCVSWINVLAHNDPHRGDQKYAPGNVFVVMTKGMKSKQKENPVKIIRWQDGSLECFHGTEAEVESYVAQKSKVIKQTYIIA